MAEHKGAKHPVDDEKWVVVGNPGVDITKVKGWAKAGGSPAHGEHKHGAWRCQVNQGEAYAYAEDLKGAELKKAEQNGWELEVVLRTEAPTSGPDGTIGLAVALGKVMYYETVLADPSGYHEYRLVGQPGGPAKLYKDNSFVKDIAGFKQDLFSNQYGFGGMKSGFAGIGYFALVTFKAK